MLSKLTSFFVSIIIALTAPGAPFAWVLNLSDKAAGGNSLRYSMMFVESLGETPLTGKKIVFLGSSVTFGSGSDGVAFPEYIEKRNACESKKYAVSGTTLADNGITSYVARFKLIPDEKADLFVCQLSTNDATKNVPLGEISDGFDADGFDTSTVAGAIEFIIASAKEKWGCPVVFYNNPVYDSENYAAMVELLERIAGKWNIGVIDLWHSEPITEEQRTVWMKDKIHPTKAGYLEWWTPIFEEYFYSVFK